jgi:hypothetical protein
MLGGLYGKGIGRIDNRQVLGDKDAVGTGVASMAIPEILDGLGYQVEIAFLIVRMHCFLVKGRIQGGSGDCHAGNG